jgi:hypothetical protein
MGPDLGGLADRLVDHGVERDGTPEELLPHWLRLRKSRASQRQGTNKPPHNLGRYFRDQGGEPATCVTEIGSRQHDAGGDDANKDLVQRMTASIKTSPLAPPVAPSSLLAMIAAVIPASCAATAKELRSTLATKAHPAPHNARPARKATRFRGKHAVNTTIATAPTTFRSCGTNLCAAKRRDVADKQEPQLFRPSKRCRARAKTRYRARGRLKPTVASQIAAVAPAALDAFARRAAKAALDATGEPCPGGPASVMERILGKLSTDIPQIPGLLNLKRRPDATPRPSCSARSARRQSASGDFRPSPASGVPPTPSATCAALR